MNSSCPLPRWDELPYFNGIQRSDKDQSWELLPMYTDTVGSFVNCSQAVSLTNEFYQYSYTSVPCLSNNHSFVYIVTDTVPIEYLAPSCGYLAMFLLSDPGPGNYYNFSHYADFVKHLRLGFSVRFPLLDPPMSIIGRINFCLNESFRDRNHVTGNNIKSWTMDILLMDFSFWACIFGVNLNSNNMLLYMRVMIHDDQSFHHVLPPVFALVIAKWIAVLCRILLAPLAVLMFLAQKYWKTRITIDAVEKFLQMQQMIGPTRYAYTDIVALTSHFRDKLGQGGYGSVFKGVLLPGNVNIAVKMLEGSSNCNGEDFISEVSTIGRIHHVNVVRLVGFCSEEMRRALVYEYMPRGSLDKYIFSAQKSFSWDKLNEIALGTARGINYLHQGCEMQILHFDIKPHNILLDNNFVPKVADFGLAKLYPRDNSFVPSNALRGTVGYIAPEMISRSFGTISSKSDVYSFGMLLLEMAGGRRNADPNAANSSQSYYPSWVYDKLTAQEADAISLVADMHELERKLCIVGLWCIQMKSHDRPTMSEVIEMLEGGFDGLQMPSRPFFCDDEHTAVPDSYPLLSELTEISAEDEISDSYVSRVL
ncbi:rust resistance kinase Lr10-like isoform X3 [Triticum aestivum]|nr:rust resistance kinase Lr10-like isoform X3 [Triticum aestivum]